MRRAISLLIALTLVVLSLSSCAVAPDNGQTDIVCTVFPIYDWAQNLLGGDTDGVSTRLLVNRGTDPHSYTPTPTDIAALHGADILIYVGGESDAWIEDVLSTIKNKEIKLIKLIDLLGDRALDADEDCTDSDCHDHEHDHEHEAGAYDEHVWLSLKNAEILCEALTAELSAALPASAEKIMANGTAYKEKLSALDTRFAEEIEKAPKELLIFADRFPFRYLTEDYSLEYEAAFSGCSADSEASFETVVRLSDKLKASDVGALMILESSSEDLARTVISNSGCEGIRIIRIDSMQSITSRDIERGETYLSIMEKNLAALIAALN